MPINKTISIPFSRSNYYTIVWRNSEEEDGKIRYMYLISNCWQEQSIVKAHVSYLWPEEELLQKQKTPGGYPGVVERGGFYGVAGRKVTSLSRKVRTVPSFVVGSVLCPTNSSRPVSVVSPYPIQV
jgi:hypothetical protein